MKAICAGVGAGAGVIGAGIAIASVLPTHRQCTIEITNECHTYTLCNPRVYTSSGRCAVPFPPTIASLTSGSALFTKTPHTARGSVGVFTFDLQKNGTDKTTEKIAVMFSVPYDFNLYLNWYAVGVFDESKECNHGLYDQMYYQTGNMFVRGQANGPCLTHKGDQFTIMATMSDSHQPVMKVQVHQNSKQ